MLSTTPWRPNTTSTITSAAASATPATSHSWRSWLGLSCASMPYRRATLPEPRCTRYQPRRHRAQPAALVHQRKLDWVVLHLSAVRKEPDAADPVEQNRHHEPEQRR